MWDAAFNRLSHLQDLVLSGQNTRTPEPHVTTPGLSPPGKGYGPRKTPAHFRTVDVPILGWRRFSPELSMLSQFSNEVGVKVPTRIFLCLPAGLT